VDLKVKSAPADAIGNAVMIARIATGEIEDITTETTRTRLPWRWGAWVARRGRQQSRPSSGRK